MLTTQSNYSMILFYGSVTQYELCIRLRTFESPWLRLSPSFHCLLVLWGCTWHHHAGVTRVLLYSCWQNAERFVYLFTYLFMYLFICLYWQYSIANGSPMGPGRSDAAWVPPWREKSTLIPLRVLPPLSPVHSTTQLYRVFEHVLLCKSPLLLLSWYESRPPPPESVWGYPWHTHWWENSQGFCIYLLHIFGLTLFRFAFFQWGTRKHLGLWAASRPPHSTAVLCQSCQAWTFVSLPEVLSFVSSWMLNMLNVGNFWLWKV